MNSLSASLKTLQWSDKTNMDRLLSFLGLCRRAGKLAIGAQVAAESIESNKSRLIIYASDFSGNSLKPVLAAAREHSVEVLMINRTKDELGFSLGKLCGAASVEDAGFAAKLSQMIKDEQGGE